MTEGIADNVKLNPKYLLQIVHVFDDMLRNTINRVPIKILNFMKRDYSNFSWNKIYLLIFSQNRIHCRSTPIIWNDEYLIEMPERW